MANSYLVPNAGERGCQGQLGAYFLPRDYLHVEVRNTNPMPPHVKGAKAALERANPRYEIVFIELRSKADRTRGFCLDYLGSMASNDYLEVKRTEGLLMRVGTTNKNYDETLVSDATATPGQIATEDVTSNSLAKELIDKSLNPGASPDALTAVTYPWNDPARPSAGSDLANPYPENPKLELFCKQEALVAANKQKPFYSDFCTQPGLPLSEPTQAEQTRFKATLKRYFSLDKPKARNETALPSAMTRLVYSRKQTFRTSANTKVELDYLESGGITGSIAEAHKPTLTPLARPDPDSLARLEAPLLWQTDTSFSADFDPANPAQAAANNFGLKDFGFCLLLNDGAVDLRDRDAYCDDPMGYAASKAWNVRKSEKFQGYVSYSEGLLYRPRLNYTLYVFKKADRKGARGWHLDGQHVVSIANLAPMISVGVKRTLFADRNTVVEFDRGALVNIAINKKSELVNALDVPLSLVKRIGALPTNIVKVRIRQTDAMQQLAIKQRELLEAEISYNDSLKRLQDAKNSANQTGGPNQ